jgi:hypothetical protein
MLREIYQVEKNVANILRDRLAIKNTEKDIIYDIQNDDDLLDKYLKRFNDMVLKRD